MVGLPVPNVLTSGRRAERQAGRGPVRGACAANPRSRRVYEPLGARIFSKMILTFAYLELFDTPENTVLLM
jgi:hypothetical protein